MDECSARGPRGVALRFRKAEPLAGHLPVCRDFSFPARTRTPKPAFGPVGGSEVSAPQFRCREIPRNFRPSVNDLPASRSPAPHARPLERSRMSSTASVRPPNQRSPAIAGITRSHSRPPAKSDTFRHRNEIAAPLISGWIVPNGGDIRHFSTLSGVCPNTAPTRGNSSQPCLKFEDERARPERRGLSLEWRLPFQRLSGDLANGDQKDQQAGRGR